LEKAEDRREKVEKTTFEYLESQATRTPSRRGHPRSVASRLGARLSNYKMVQEEHANTGY
jgi:hypothetical protein